MKTIVGTGEIATDPKLAIVKKFRCVNKKAGDIKREFQLLENGEGDDTSIAELKTEYDALKGELVTLAAQATENGFKIWVNPNGKTGHTYANDYKETADTDNDEVEAKKAFVRMEILHRFCGFGISLN